MARVIPLIAASCALWTAVARAQQVPYRAVVTGNNVYFRSGPGENYYPTGKLHKGDVVTVHRHDPGGWFAIAPPPGSFSWIAGDEVREEANGWGTVTGNRVKVRVGSFNSEERDVYQVTLTEGARVKIIDRRSTQTGDQEEVWYRIVPPEGEFRWIAGRYVQAVAEQSAGASTADASEGRKGAAGVASDQAADDPFAPAGSSVTEPLQTRRPQPYLNDKATGSRSAPKPREKTTPRPQPARSKQPETRSEPASSTIRFDPSGPLLVQANRELYKMVQQDMAVWDFSKIRPRYEQAAARATTRTGRARVRLGLKRLAHYEEIKRIDDRFKGTLARSRYRDRKIEEARKKRPVETAEARPRYDGTGILRRTAVQGATAPYFSLTDREGNVRYYVVPGAEVDLRPYVGQTIAVLGNVGYRSDLLAHQITVREVVPIQQTAEREVEPENRRYRPRR